MDQAGSNLEKSGLVHEIISVNTIRFHFKKFYNLFQKDVSFNLIYGFNVI